MPPRSGRRASWSPGAPNPSTSARRRRDWGSGWEGRDVRRIADAGEAYTSLLELLEEEALGELAGRVQPNAAEVVDAATADAPAVDVFHSARDASPDVGAVER